jgi:hypothetical protein
MPSRNEVRKIAKEKNVSISYTTTKYNTKTKTKDMLIKDIQISEGNSPCFKTITDCGINECLWFSDCQKKKYFKRKERTV